MHNVAFIFGTRPEAIKMAPVIAEAARSRTLRPRVVVSAQHRDLLDGAMDSLGLAADIDLDLMRDNQSLESLTAAAVPAISRALAEVKPDFVLVQGDTTTAFAGALAAFYRKLPVGHIEAGLRSGDPLSPFPEEINRVLVDHIATLHFAPTPAARRQLLDEGISPAAVTVTGNTGIDQLLITAQRTDLERLVRPAELLAVPRPFILVTAHRRENHGPRLLDICAALRQIVRRFPGQTVVFPAHPNPNVQSAVRTALAGQPAIRVLPPVDYSTMVWLMRQARLILSDSGGVQEEAPYLGKPLLVLRDTTERPEGVRAGLARLVGTRPETILAAVGAALADGAPAGPPPAAGQLYGDGHASRRIIATIEQFLGRPTKDQAAIATGRASGPRPNEAATA